MKNKTKTFISVIPFQGKNPKTGKDALEEVHYTPVGNEKLRYEKTRFPIVPVIANYVQKGDNVRVVAVLTEGDNFKHNYETYFEPEINTLKEKIGFTFDGMEIVETPDSEEISVQLKLFCDIIGKVHENEELYACITYGTKPTPIVLSMALNYANQLKKDTSVECIVYGRFLHKNAEGTGEGNIYDTTSLFYMDSIVNKLAAVEANDPEAAIRLMLGLEDAD